MGGRGPFAVSSSPSLPCRGAEGADQTEALGMLLPQQPEGRCFQIQNQIHNGSALKCMCVFVCVCVCVLVISLFRL